MRHKTLQKLISFCSPRCQRKSGRDHLPRLLSDLTYPYLFFNSSIRSLFLSADPAQSVELGVKMREGTVNDVIHSLVKDGKQQVKDVLQYISLQTNDEFFFCMEKLAT